jgi:hypothetical protein
VDCPINDLALWKNSASSTCDPCSSGEFANFTGWNIGDSSPCTTCVNGCLTCSSATTCLTCTGDLALLDGTCYSNCPEHRPFKYVPSNFSGGCYVNGCTAQADGYYLFQDPINNTDTCVQNCPVKTMLNSDKTRCVSCTIGC